MIKRNSSRSSTSASSKGKGKVAEQGDSLLDEETELKFTQSNEDGFHSASNFRWSPNGEFLAVSVKHRILIRNASGFSLHQTYPIAEGVKNIDGLEWSSDSLYLAAVCKGRGVISVRRLDRPDWKCRIDLGGETKGLGLLLFSWSPDARHILTTSAFYTQLTVWSLSRSMVTSFRNICPTPRYKSFSSGGRMLAVSHFDSEFNTCLSIYESSEWNLKDTFSVTTRDLEGVEWCPNDSSLLLWDSPLFSNLYVYSPSGQILKHYSPDGLSTGIQSIRWSPTGQLLALSNHRSTLRILNGLTYGVLLEEEMELSLTQPSIHEHCILYREIITEKGGIIKHQYEVDKTWNWSSCSGDSSSDPCINGNGPAHMDTMDYIKFSWDGKFMACISADNHKRLWIWDLEKVTLSTVLVHLLPILDFQWDPNYSRLLLSTGGRNIYFWTPSKSYVKSIASFSSNSNNDHDFKAEMISWNPNGISFCVQNLSVGRIIVGFLKSTKNK